MNFGGGEVNVNAQSPYSQKFQYFPVRELKTDITMSILGSYTEGEI